MTVLSSFRETGVSCAPVTCLDTEGPIRVAAALTGGALMLLDVWKRRLTSALVQMLRTFFPTDTQGQELTF